MSDHKTLKYIGLLLVLILCAPYSFGQRERNYIFLFDCTGSMERNGLWENAQSALDKNISLRTSIPDAQFSVIPFGDSPYETYVFSNNEYQGKKSTISDAFNNYIRQARYTNISDVLKAGFKQVNTNKENEIYLFTDGMPNGVDSSQKVAQTISEWCADHRFSKLYYVALTKGVVNPVIRQAIDACEHASIVQCENGIIPVITEISSDVYTNLEELDDVAVLSSNVPGDYKLTSLTVDKYFDLKIIDNKASEGKVQVKVVPKDNLSVEQLHKILQGNEYEFTSVIKCEDSGFVIANPIITVHVSDEVPSKLTLAQGVNELRTDGVEWYDSFLWNNAAQEQKAVWNLNPVFKNELSSSLCRMKFQAEDGKTSDFKAWYNGQSIGDGSIIMIKPNSPAKIEMQFNHDAAQGKRYFKLLPVEVDNITFINDCPSDNYDGTTLRTVYDVDWNPLKTCMFWLFVVLVVALFVWFTVLKHILFPVIRISRITITGPGTYYISLKIRGARKVILTSRKESQNIFSRIFTGEIRYVKAVHFSPEISIVPVRGKKKVTLSTDRSISKKWNIYPSSIFGLYDSGTLVNESLNIKSEIKF